MSTNPTPVTVIGLGPMGQAMVRSWLAAGHPVTVWNRTAARADDVVAAAAVRAATAAEAVAASPLVVLSLTDYPSMDDILGPVGAELEGRVVVNLSSDTPERTREAADRLAARGAQLLAGGVMVPAPVVGADASHVFYSGPRAVFEDHEPTLRVIGVADYRGVDPALAQLFYQNLLTVFLTSLTGILQGSALVASAGVPAREFLPYVTDMLNLAGADLGATAQELDERTYPGHLSSAAMMGATADHIAAASRAAGVDTALPDAVTSLYDRAIAEGHGKDNWTSLYEVIAR